MTDIAIYGAGGLGREMKLLIEQINAKAPQWNLVGFYDDNKQGSFVDGIKVLGGIDALNRITMPLALVIAIADGQVRQNIVSNITSEMVNFPVLIHPSANIGSAQNDFGRGTIICAGAILTVGVTLHEFVIVNLAATIGHDVTIGPYSSLMPGCNISGAVKIDSHVLIGTGSQVLQGITIGSQSRVGAGAVVTRDVPAMTTVIGVPAKVYRSSHH